MPFDDACFDVLSCVATLEHIFNPVELLKEVRQVLKFQGRLMLVVTNITYLPRPTSAVLCRPPKTSTAAGVMDGGMLHYLTLNSLVSLHKQYGFFIIRKGTAGKF